MATDSGTRSIPKTIYIRVGEQICWIYPPLNKHNTLVAIGPGQICVSKNKTDDKFSNKDFPRTGDRLRRQLGLEKLKRGTD